MNTAPLRRRPYLSVLCFAALAAHASERADQTELRINLAPPSPDKLDRLRQETETDRFKALLPKDRLREVVRLYIDLQNDRPLPSLPEPAVTKLNKLAASGFANDPVYVRNATQALISALVVRPTGPDSAHPDCVVVHRNGSRDFCCSGTLIAPQLVITAGHAQNGGCGGSISTGASVSTPDETVEAVPVGHPHYQGVPPANDLALLVLKEPIKRVVPRGIAKASETNAAGSATIVGFGRIYPDSPDSSGTRMFATPLVMGDVGMAGYGANLVTEFVLAPIPNPTGPDTCEGDSGGPAYITTADGDLLAGVTSRGVTDVCGEGGIYVRVSAYLDWINSVADAHGVERPKVR